VVKVKEMKGKEKEKMNKKETHMVMMRNTPAALSYDDDNENDGEPLSRSFLPSFFFFPFLPFFHPSAN